MDELGRQHHEVVFTFLACSFGKERGLGFMRQAPAGFRQASPCSCVAMSSLTPQPLPVQHVATKVHRLPAIIQKVQ